MGMSVVLSLVVFIVFVQLSFGLFGLATPAPTIPKELVAAKRGA
jgi:hypothetical protein